MSPSLAAETITLAEFEDVLSRYDALIRSLSSSSKKKKEDGETLEQLDAYRLLTVPARLRETGGELYLEKEEVERLIRWKLYV